MSCVRPSELSYEGTSDSRPNFGLVFRAPGLAERQPHGPAVHYWVLNPACPGLLGRMDLEDQWWAIANGVPAEVGEADPLALIRGLVGTEIDCRGARNGSLDSAHAAGGPLSRMGESFWQAMPRISIRRGVGTASTRESAMP